MDYVFKNYSVADMQNKGKGYKLLEVLNNLYPDVFQNFYLTFSVSTSLLNAPSPFKERCEFVCKRMGLITMEVDNKLVFVSIVSANTIKRIFTLPRFRNKGYALYFLKYMRTFSDEPLTSPVEPHIIPLFKKAGWFITQEVNQDGTINMISIT